MSDELDAARAALDLAVVAADQRGGPEADAEAEPAEAFRAVVAWAADEPLLRGRAYELRLGEQVATATVAPLRYRLDPATGEHVAATALCAGEIGVCDIELDEPVALLPAGATAGVRAESGIRAGSGVRAESGVRAGSDADPAIFTLLDRVGGGATVGVGRLRFPLRRSQNVQWQALAVDKPARATRLGQRPTVLWLTGLSGAGKSTIANLVETELYRRGHLTYVLDGDNVRHGLNADLGFTAADRVENIRRVGEVAALMVDAGLIVIVSFISPFRAERSMARSRVGEDEFIEVHVDAPLEVAEERDPKGLYEKARRGELANFTGIDSPYEPPEGPEIHLDTSRLTPDQAAQRVIEALERGGRLEPPPRGLAD
jgi:bifunctional enzyme CysN/CysC